MITQNDLFTESYPAETLRQRGTALLCLPLFVMALAVATPADAETFRKARMIDPKGQEQPVELGFDRATRVLTVKAVGEIVHQVPYAMIDKLSYEVASRRRVREGAVVMIFSLGAGGAVMLTKSRSHWFYVDFRSPTGDTKTLTLKLDKKEYKNVLAVAADQTGKAVETLEHIKRGSSNKK